MKVRQTPRNARRAPTYCSLSSRRCAQCLLCSHRTNSVFAPFSPRSAINAATRAASLVPEPPPPASFFSFFRKATPGDFAGAGRRLGGEPAPSRLLGSAESNA